MNTKIIFFLLILTLYTPHSPVNDGIKPDPTSMSTSDAMILWSFEAKGWIRSTPAIGDVDGDGDPDVVFGSNDHRTYALDGATGTLLWSFKTMGMVRSAPAIGDVDGDGDSDVVFGSDDNRTYALDGATGTLLWSSELGGVATTPPSIGDIDGDGDLDVVIGASDDNTYAMEGRTGELSWSNRTIPWPYHGIVRSSYALGDVNGNGIIDVVAVAMNGVVVIDGATGNRLWHKIWSVYTWGASVSPNLADVDGDGELDIIMGGMGLEEAWNSICVIDGTTGEFIMTRTAPNVILFDDTAIGDVNGDGRLDIVTGADVSHGSISGPYMVYLFDALTGRQIWSTEIEGDPWYGSSLGDIDGDGGLDVVLNTLGGHIYVIDGNTGDILSKFSTGQLLNVHPVLSDVDGDGDLDLIAGGGPAVVAYEMSDRPGRVFWEGLGGDMSFQRRNNIEYIDADHDMLSDYSEGLYGTDCNNNDTDGDGMADGWEVSNGLDPHADDASLDDDGDGLTNLDEFRLGTSITDADTDGDGLPDGVEQAIGYDPLDPADGVFLRGALSLVGLTGVYLVGIYVVYRYLKKHGANTQGQTPPPE